MCDPDRDCRLPTLNFVKMSVLINFAMFPTSQGESVSCYVARIVDYIASCGFPYQFTSMSTTVETATVAQALGIVQGCYDLLEPDCNRVYATMTMDVRKDHKDCLAAKVGSVEAKVGHSLSK